MRIHRIRRAALAAAIAGLAVASAASAAPTTGTATPHPGGAVASAPHVAVPTARQALTGSVPAWAKPADLVGTPADSDPVTVTVVLALRDAAAAQRLALDVSDPRSRDYGHYLSAAEFNRRFAPSAAAVGRVKKFLADSGLSVGTVAQGNRWVQATADVATVDRAFSTSVRTYKWRGRVLRAPSTTPSVPVTIAPDVATVTGLDDSGLLRHPYSQRRPNDVTTSGAKGGPKATPPSPTQCSNYWAQYSQTVPAAYGRSSFPTYNCGYVASQLRSAYGLTGPIASGKTGKGVTVAIIDAYGSPTMLADANRYSKLVGIPAFATGQYKQTLFKPFTMQKLCDAAGWNTEQTLDVEAVHSIAPGATVRYVGAKNCDTGIDAALNYVIQNQLADIISNSYGYAGEDVPPATQRADESLFIQAAAEGIGVYFSSGDFGDEVTIGNTTSAQPDFPASNPMVTAVGGTSLAVTQSGAYDFETGWGSAHDVVDFSGATAGYQTPLPGPFLFGAGGGTSTLYAQPAYQAGVVPDSLSRKYGNAPARVVPDVAAVGDPYTGFLIGQTIGGQFVLGAIGGTSLACPVFAGIQALASTGRATSIGFANPLLYSLAAGTFRDIVPTRSPIAVTTPTGSSLTTFDRDSTLATSTGYDDVTGRGTPKGASLIAAEN